MMVRRMPEGRYVWLHNPAAVAVHQTLRARFSKITEIDLPQGGLAGHTKPPFSGASPWTFDLAPGETRIFHLTD
jgi:hypothetical protein